MRLMAEKRGRSSGIIIVTALVLIVGLASWCYAQDESLPFFYARAYALTQAPPAQSKLSIICQKKISNEAPYFPNHFVNFVGVQKHKVLLAAITKGKLKNPQRNLYLRNRIVLAGDKKTKTVWDWAYVFDRNGDGKIDYFAFLIGPMPVKPKDFPSDYPPTTNNAVMLSKKQLIFHLHNMKLVFAHVADENFDGKPDATVRPAFDAKYKTWVNGWVVLRDSKSSGTLDECWYFREDMAKKEIPCERSDSGFYVPNVHFSSAEAIQQFEVFSKLLTAFNATATECRLSKDSFYQEPPVFTLPK